MTNITKMKRDRMIDFLEELKSTHTDDESIRAFNEIENALTEKKFGLVFEEHTEEVDERLLNEIPVFCADEDRKICKDKDLPYNFIIEGDNLQALYLLEKTHRGKVDCIYIDPPYNTGARDWKYNNDYADKNDIFRHSKWLSMMHSRLIIAKKLLTDDGVLICAIDENEQANLHLLLEDIFGISYSIDCITIEHNPRGVQGKNFSYTHEYALFVYKKGEKVILDRKLNEEEIKPSQFRNWGAESLRSDARNCFYPVYVKDEEIIGFGDVLTDENVHPDKNEICENDVIAVYPIDNNGVERKWRYARQTVDEIKDLLLVKKNRQGVLEINIAKKFGKYKTVWSHKKYDANKWGTQLINSMVPHNDFNFPKSLYNVYDCLAAVIRDKPNAIVLDFFAGSGTTMHALNLLNTEDNGNRKCIVVTNNALSEKQEKALTKKGYAPGDEEWEKLGIAKYITWPRIFCSIQGTNILGEELTGTYLNTDREMREGFNTNVKYFKCDWTPRRPEDYLLSNALLLHIKEMIELEHFIEIDNERYVVILNKDDFNEYILNDDIYSKIEKVWVNQNIIFTSDELKKLKNKDFRYIPREYFGHELKEAAE